MSRPTPVELDMALAEAARLRESGEDEHYLGKSLMNLNYRLHFLEEVLTKAKLYLHSGEGAHEHSALLHAIQRAEKASQALGDEEDGLHPW